MLARCLICSRDQAKIIVCFFSFEEWLSCSFFRVIDVLCEIERMFMLSLPHVRWKIVFLYLIITRSRLLHVLQRQRLKLCIMLSYGMLGLGM